MNITHYFNTPESSVLTFVGYDKDESALTVSFVNGSASTYLDVPADKFTDFQAAGSRGQHYNYYIKGEYSTETDPTVMLSPDVLDVSETPPVQLARLLNDPEAVTESDDVTESDNDLEAAFAGATFELTFDHPSGNYLSGSVSRDVAVAVYAALKPLGWTVSLDD